MDIPDIRRVIQFMVPNSLNEWVQRYGRAGRDGKAALAILIVEPSVYETIRKPKLTKTNIKSKTVKQRVKVESPVVIQIPGKRKRVSGGQDVSEEPQDGEQLEEGSDDEGFQQKKNVQDVLRKWIETIDCRRLVCDEYFDNPPRTKGKLLYHYVLQVLALILYFMLDLTVPCCDNCLMKRGDNSTLTLTDADIELLALIAAFNNEGDIVDPPAKPINVSESDINLEDKQFRRRGARRGEHLKMARTFLESWRRQCWWTQYQNCAFGPEAILPNKIMTAFASQAAIETLDDINRAVPDWDFIEEYGEEVLKTVRRVDKLFNEQKDGDKAERNTKKMKTEIPTPSSSQVNIPVVLQDAPQAAPVYRFPVPSFPSLAPPRPILVPIAYPPHPTPYQQYYTPPVFPVQPLYPRHPPPYYPYMHAPIGMYPHPTILPAPGTWHSNYQPVNPWFPHVL